MSGEVRAKNRLMPVSVPPEPTPQTIGVDAALHLLPDFRRGAGLVRKRVGRIGELIDIDGARGLGRDALGEVLVIGGMALAHVGAGHHDFGPHRLEMEHLLAAHLVRNDQDEAVALERRDERKAEAGIARGRLHQRAAGPQPAVALERGDHGERRAILDRAARVLSLQLDEQAASSRVEPGDLDQRRIADQLDQPAGDMLVAERMRGGAHGRASAMMRSHP